MKPEHKHQCRYCATCVVTADDIPICEDEEVQKQWHGDGLPYKFNRPNRCKRWIYNEIAADFWGNDRERSRLRYEREKRQALQSAPAPVPPHDCRISHRYGVDSSGRPVTIEMRH